jgi:transcriptional regulator with XRE-family HTH domain
MTLGEKLRYLRLIEGTLRGLDRPMTQGEVVRAVRSELGLSISQAYLSQIERGSRPHLTNRTRMLLAKFFGVHPGYLVDDPEGFHQELTSPVRTLEDKLDLWLIQGAERFSGDRELRRALLAVAQHPHSRECFLLLHGIVETPSLAERLLEILAPDGAQPETASYAAAVRGAARRKSYRRSSS